MGVVFAGCICTMGLFAVIAFLTEVMEAIYDNSPKLQKKIKKIFEFLSQDFL